MRPATDGPHATTVRASPRTPATAPRPAAAPDPPCPYARLHRPEQGPAPQPLLVHVQGLREPLHPPPGGRRTRTATRSGPPPGHGPAGPGRRRTRRPPGRGPRPATGMRSPASTLLCRKVPCSSRASGGAGEQLVAGRERRVDQRRRPPASAPPSPASPRPAARSARPPSRRHAPAGGSTHSRRSVPAASSSAFASGSERTDTSGCSRSSSRRPRAPAGSRSCTAPRPSQCASAARSLSGRARAGRQLQHGGRAVGLPHQDHQTAAPAGHLHPLHGQLA